MINTNQNWSSLYGSGQEVQILIGGQPIKVRGAGGKQFVEARRGAHYEIKLRNNACRRVLAVVSVDGLDVLTGTVASPDSGGYVLEPFSTYTIKGFRVSNEEVNRFEFSAKNESYAKLGEDGEQSTQNCGVIGVQFYREKERPMFVKKYLAPPQRPHPWVEPYSIEPFSPVWRNDEVICNLAGDKGNTVLRSRSLEASSLCTTMDADFDMGTKFSEEVVADKVTSTTFVRDGIASTHTIYYASRRNLEAFGVVFDVAPKVSFPEPFKPNGYCKPPKRK